jgi:hypothetical protein
MALFSLVSISWHSVAKQDEKPVQGSLPVSDWHSPFLQASGLKLLDRDLRHTGDVFDQRLNPPTAPM